MKFKFLVCLLILAVLCINVVCAENDIAVVVDGETLSFDVAPTVIGGRTLVPVRSIFEALGATIEWDAVTSTCTATRDDTTVKITIDEPQMYVNGEAKALDTPAKIIGSRTLIPLRAVSEAFECEVIWQGSIRTAVILSDPANYTALYDLSGNCRVFKNDEVEAQLTVGWYREPSQILYAPDGRTQVFPKDKVAAQLAVGWFENRSDVFTPLYAPDGRVIEKPNSEVETYKNLGWYTEPQSLTVEDSDAKDGYNWQYGGGYLYIFNDNVSTAVISSDYSWKSTWYDHYQDIRTLYIGYGIDLPGTFTFEGFKNLSRVELSPTVTSIGHYTFDKTSISRIGIPSSVTDFDAYAFDTYGLNSYSDNANKNMVIYCEPGSYAETFAKKSGVQYVHASPVYYPDGRCIMATAEEKEVYLRYGWYAEPVIMMYAADGRTLVCPIANAEANEQVGWHIDKDDVYTKMYALDGRTLEVLDIKVAEYQNVGWYLIDDYICAMADQYVSTDGYDFAVLYLEFFLLALDDTSTPQYYKLYSKYTDLINKWRVSIYSPIAIESYSMGSNSIGTPEVTITVRNLTNKTVKAFDINFTCYDAYGNATTDYPSLYNGTINGNVSSTTLEPYERASYTWTLYNNERTTSIGNYYIVRAAYSDGSTWYN